MHRLSRKILQNHVRQKRFEFNAIGICVLNSLRCEFEHAYLFRDKDSCYLPEEWFEDDFSEEKSLTDATLDDVHPFSGNQIILEYDTGNGWEFVYKREKEIDGDVYGINIEAKGDRIWEDAHGVFGDFLEGKPVERDAVWNMPDGSNPENFDDPIDIDQLNDETQIASMDIFDE